MSALEFGKPKRRFALGGGTLLIVLAVGLIAGGFWLVPRFEWHKPAIKITPDSDTIGLGTIVIEASDRGSGLKSFSATLTSS